MPSNGYRTTAAPPSLETPPTRPEPSACGCCSRPSAVRNPTASEAFVKTLKRDYARVTILPDANTILALLPDWIEDYCEVHPHSGLKFRSPREFIRLRA